MRKNLIQMLIGLLFLTSIIGVSLTQTIFAQPQASVRSEAINAPDDDGGTAEVGVEWITDWPGTADDRANWYYSCNNFYNQLGGAGWVKRFNYGNNLAWEEDFKGAAYGGKASYYSDSVDLAMMCTHGSSQWDPRYNISLSSVYYSTNHDDLHLSPGEAYRSYGSDDLEWLAFDSCSVLRDDSMYYWHETFNGLHLMVGFANTMYVVYPGDGGVWGDQMQKKGWWIFGHGAKTVTQAWFTAVEDQQPSGVRGRVLAEELNSYNDYIWGQGYVSPDYPNNGSYWYWDHVSGTPAPLQLTQNAPAFLPVVLVVPRVVDENYVLNIGQAFGLTSEVLQSPDGSAFYMVGGVDDEMQVKVDTASGGFFYQNLGELWTDPVRGRTLPASDREVSALVMNFLGQHDNLPGAFDFDQNIDPTIELEGPNDGLGIGLKIAATVPTTPTNYAISFARTVDIGGGETLSIVGPGSRQNVYVGDNGEIIGFKGGWRAWNFAQLNNGLDATTAVTTSIKSAEQAWSDFLADPSIALAETPIADTYDTSGQPEPTLAYYEQPLAMHQNELIPVWIFQADLYVDDASAPGGQALVTADAKLYVPAAADEMALPHVSITDPISGTTILPGQTINLIGTVTGGQEPYSIAWLSSVDGFLGSDLTLNDVLLHADMTSDRAQIVTITLQVIDDNGVVATADVSVTILSQAFLPALTRIN